MLRLVTQGLHVWVNSSCTVGRLMTAVTKMATHQQGGSDVLGFAEVGHKASVGWPDEVQGTRVYFGAPGVTDIWASMFLL